MLQAIVLWASLCPSFCPALIPSFCPFFLHEFEILVICNGLLILGSSNQRIIDVQRSIKDYSLTIYATPLSDLSHLIFLFTFL